MAGTSIGAATLKVTASTKGISEANVEIKPKHFFGPRLDRVLFWYFYVMTVIIMLCYIFTTTLSILQTVGTAQSGPSFIGTWLLHYTAVTAGVVTGGIILLLLLSLFFYSALLNVMEKGKAKPTPTVQTR